ncbi:MAG: tRNA (guanosine(46)-N7)-methyltransferase TrmB [Bacteroidales bacterium]|jgi:tRNA (guanine-N7-)-methyltransferase|nr:tRNA (guanosine(46)-N7)-methyltransferase TrmB [Bacteroidales bacterium]MDD2824382.1 tRNA (guanosine(46)-N7)-methyltransferase TrmB [Bacteroidales bacterium]MDD3101114.1 tRNA (guanosine(46)-N7)-methyltransferase TrmB [Bacteroidales bacterium]MDD3638971.1 tRNA (guanosine(46)-N7)-methyltransferase TrmB [Bacteroidales bacterium]MDD3943706.1 tRNA (guanosine(46)-N7)-methyltransferase TrmB [Bacteroidales bacterium]
MGKDKLRRFEENKTFPNLFQASYDEVFQKDHPLKGLWKQKVFGNENPLVLELGCGKGEYTLALARRNREVNYIGIDIKGARLWRGAKTSQQEGLKNVAFIRTRIELIESFFAPAEVNAVWITFPDPQPRKENKRLTSARFLERYLNFLVPHAQIHLKTDSRSLYDFTREVVRGWPGMILLESDPDIYNGKRMPDDPVITVRTFYEKQFLEQGKAITYLKFSTGNLSRVNPEEA